MSKYTKVSANLNFVDRELEVLKKTKFSNKRPQKAKAVFLFTMVRPQPMENLTLVTF